MIDLHRPAVLFSLLSPVDHSSETPGHPHRWMEADVVQLIIFSTKKAWMLLWSPFRCHTYVSLSQKVHLHSRVLGFTTRQLLQIRDWHSSQRSPRSKIRPRVLRQRVHCRAPKSCGRIKPFCLTSSSSFFSLLRDRNTRMSQDTKKSKRDDGEFKWWRGSPHRILFSSLFLSFSSFCSTFRIISRSCSSRKERFRSFPDCSIDPTVTSYPVMSARGIRCMEGVSKNYIILQCSSCSFSAGKVWIQSSQGLSRISSFIWFYFGGEGKLELPGDLDKVKQTQRNVTNIHLALITL